MKTVIISVFKAKCIELLKQVQAGEPLQVTLRGKPLVVIYPPPSSQSMTPEFGALHQYTTIHGDLLESENDDWEMNRE